ncbi:zinc metalloproteinase nas-4-like [Rhopilema esculentum]|uniref:zinc metalloproteinase nas-4-like n=1 Tax=Rhopilema esculentum TaxID=499914 RepID=UPI0031D8B0F5
MLRRLVFVVFLAILLDKSIKFSYSLPRHLQEADDSFEKLEELRRFEKDREKDREHLRKKTTSDEAGNIVSNGELFEGDMIMDDDLRQAVLGEADKRSILKNSNKLWLDKIVPYEFARNINEASKECILNAIESFHKHTCIRFKKREKEQHYIYIKSEPRVCMSYVGKQHGKQPLTIGKGCTRLGTCQHELLHALGVIHEQSRPDRDEHVNVVWSNINENEKNNFRKYSYLKVTEEDIPYDFMSVMHYPNHAFAKDRSEPTLVSLKDPSLVFGQRDMFTVGDVATINKMYKCPKNDFNSELPDVLSDEEVEKRRDMRETFDFSF